MDTKTQVMIYGLIFMIAFGIVWQRTVNRWKQRFSNLKNAACSAAQSPITASVGRGAAAIFLRRMLR